jgi:hypothetical protein
MAEKIDAEIDALRSVLAALEPLSTEARASVLDYVVRRLQIELTSVTSPPGQDLGNSQLGSQGQAKPQVAIAHIKTFKEQKNPTSANEMAALVAFFLSELSHERKKTINAKDIETYFKIGEFPLPGRVTMTLPNAKAAGYFDATGDGEYRLNAVGHNLVVHSLPRGSGAAAPKKAKARKKR